MVQKSQCLNFIRKDGSFFEVPKKINSVFFFSKQTVLNGTGQLLFFPRRITLGKIPISTNIKRDGVIFNKRSKNCRDFVKPLPQTLMHNVWFSLLSPFQHAALTARIISTLKKFRCQVDLSADSTRMDDYLRRTTRYCIWCVSTSVEREVSRWR